MYLRSLAFSCALIASTSLAGCGSDDSSGRGSSGDEATEGTEKDDGVTSGNNSGSSGASSGGAAEQDGPVRIQNLSRSGSGNMLTANFVLVKEDIRRIDRIQKVEVLFGTELVASWTPGNGCSIFLLQQPTSSAVTSGIVEIKIPYGDSGDTDDDFSPAGAATMTCGETAGVSRPLPATMNSGISTNAPLTVKIQGLLADAEVFTTEATAQP